MTVTSYIALGSNLESPEDQLKRALKHLAQLTDCHLTRISSFYHNPALSPSQPDYINAVVELTTQLSAQNLLQGLQNIEHKQGRVRTEHWGARTLDLDMILYGNEIIESEELKIPHPRMLERPFVLIPLLEIAPQLVLPTGVTLASACVGKTL